jgi:hypothetical protein
MNALFRTLTVLQTSGKYGVAISLDSKKRDKVIVQIPQKIDEMNERLEDPKYERIDFHL